MDFSEQQIHRYARHIILREIGGTGQARLLQAKVLIVGAGGLGSPLALYLAAAGIGTIGLVDDDRVDLSNLQRQISHGVADIGTEKTASAAAAMARINPDIAVIRHDLRLDAANALTLVGGYDVVADGSDNFATRYAVHDASYFARKILVSAAILRFDGQLSTFKAWQGNPHPCYRCLFPQPPPPDSVPSCAQAGVLGSLAGTIGAMQATEVVKEILGIGASLSGTVLLYDALEARLQRLALARNPACPLCGDKPSIKDMQGGTRGLKAGHAHE